MYDCNETLEIVVRQMYLLRTAYELRKMGVQQCGQSVSVSPMLNSRLYETLLVLHAGHSDCFKILWTVFSSLWRPWDLQASRHGTIYLLAVLR
jgi:hypothetical protein